MPQADIRIFADKPSLNTAVTQQIITLAQQAIAEHGRFLMALSGGGTPQGVYEQLAQPEIAQQIAWSQVHLFWGDERLVPPDQPGSNYRQAHDTFISKVNIPTENVHRVKGELPAETAVRDYTQQLAQFTSDKQFFPQLDLAIMGMGADGHTASLFPGPIPPAETASPVMAVTAEYEDRPAHRLTLTPMIFNAAHHVIFLVTGENKAEALTAVLNGPTDHQNWPAQRIQPTEGTLTYFIDTPAAQRLR